MAKYRFKPPLVSIGAFFIIAAFVVIAGQRLGTTPLPDTDESMTLQVPYEMLNRGKLAFPMYQFVGGNIENTWHSFTPVFFLILNGFLKVFGWGLLQGRAFNLACAALLLLLIYLIGRRLIHAHVGLIAVVLVVCDPVFLARSRLIRNDLLAADFGLLAFYLFDCAMQREKKRYFAGSGLAAGAAVMCHTNLIYMLAVIAVLMMMRYGISMLWSERALLFAASAFAVMSYEIVYDLVDYKNFVLQNRRDQVHFGVLRPWGWWVNLSNEPRRYIDWYRARGLEFVPTLRLQHLYLFLTAVAIVYLVGRAAVSFRRPNAVGEPRVRILVTTLVVTLFFALITQRKVIQYIVHLSPWFALCVGVMVKDGFALIGNLRTKPQRWAVASYAVAASLATLLIMSFFYQLGAKYFAPYLKEVRDPDLPSFDEIREVARSVVPEGLCPAAIGSGYLWLAFPEHDRCFFAHMETTTDEPLDLDGKDYALFVRPKSREKQAALIGHGLDQYHLLAELHQTAYGTLNVYYTGTDSRYLSLPTRRFYFFGRSRGHVGEYQIASGRDVWAVEPPRWRDVSASVELKHDTIYQLNVDAELGRNWEVDIKDDTTGAVILRADAPVDDARSLFKTGKGETVRVSVRSIDPERAATLSISRMRIREIAPVPD